MSKINAIRIINLNYNNNSIKINDETLQLEGESTLLSLRNGGGKSVLVQMVMAPFMHKRYKDAKDRPFASYFTSNKPTFVMIEWALDGGAGYVLTGMMVRKNQDLSEEGNNELEIIQFITEYKSRCAHDIYHLPVVEKQDKGINLKGYHACRQLFEVYKKENSKQFYYYDMNLPAQSKQYFDKLKDYQINYKEWETIIKKVNLKESGLSDLFSEAKDEKGLVEKWFLEAVESKLNKDKNRMKEFERILGKYIMQYKENQSKIQRKDTILQFKQKTLPVLEQARAYEKDTFEKRAYENKTACFIKKLAVLCDEANLEREEFLDRIVSMEREIKRLDYEEISLQIYQAEEEKDFHIRENIMTLQEQEHMENGVEQLERRLHILECAKYKGYFEEADKELRLCKNRVEIAKKNKEELEPERNQIGSELYHYYEEEKKKKSEEIREIENHSSKRLEEEEILRLQIKEEEDNHLNLLSKRISLLNKISMYDERENWFNDEYEEDIHRNIMGEYEPAALDIKGQYFQEEEENLQKEWINKKKEKEETVELIYGLERKLEDIQKELFLSQEAIWQRKEKQDSLKAELTERSTILKYLELSEEKLFETEMIKDACQQKMRNTIETKRFYEKEYDSLEKEYHRLTQGMIIELPKDFKELLEESGIQYIYGMEWLKKNQRSEQENQKLVKKHPFIPYSIILSGNEVKKLQRLERTVYTSFPIPIIRREELDQGYDSLDTPLLAMDKVSFFVMFNDSLLNEAELGVLIEKKKEEMCQKEEIIFRKEEEYRGYLEKLETIKRQKVSRKGYDELNAQIEEEEIREKDLEENCFKLKEDQKEKKKYIELLNKFFTQEILHLKQIQDKIRNYHILVSLYEEYKTNRSEEEKVEHAISSLEQKIELKKERKESLQKEDRFFHQRLLVLQNEEKKIMEKAATFEEYKNKVREETLLSVGLKELEARYEAIMNFFSREEKEVFRELNKAQQNQKKKEEELFYIGKKYKLSQSEYWEVDYNRYEESQLEETFEINKHKEELLQSRWNQTDKKIAILTQQIMDAYQNMKEKCGEETPAIKSSIIRKEFKRIRNQRLEDIRRETVKLDSIDKKIQSYKENSSSLAEYNNLSIEEEIIWDEDFIAMTANALNEYKGCMIRDYKDCINKERSKKEKLQQMLNDLARIEDFCEDFFMRPIEALLRITEDAQAVIAQLNTTIASYDNLMEKLMVDISMIEKERDKVIELLEDYLKEVHHSLGEIDKNSTITIRDRTIKMLKINLPDWEESETLYRTRLNDFMEEITRKGIEILARNENIEEYVGTRATTKHLYDTVVGIGHVEIRLYKIEEQREYPITWSEVSKNSGGEGFLSAFVILSSLLYYMRKDDTDIFAEKEEGKVLIMDNPFAQTHSSHLLKPLMDIAKKTNTQLICLSGLGGDAIYNRFDNIYVLTLISANLKSGMQYLKSDHIKGSEEETMLVSHIHVEEQLDLIF
ncbi:MAG: hypothetical protein ACERKN_12360 [Velocimicrobium sp.]